MSDNDFVKIQIGSKYFIPPVNFDLKLAAENDPVLFTKCSDVDLLQIDHNTNLAEAMKRLCRKYLGLGLSANQVGISKNMFVLSLDDEYAAVFDTVFINPTILELSQRTVVYEEGCLSFPNIMLKVARPDVVTLQWYNLHGTERVFTFDGMISRIIQHEMEHLEGKSLLDHMTPFERRRKFEQRAKRLKKAKRT